jgi:intracellular multiplication protein IcmD
MLFRHFFYRLYPWNVVRLIGWGMLLLSIQPQLTFGAATVAQFAGTVRTTFALVKDLMVVVAFVCGMVFAIIGMLKFKAHKDNPVQIPLSTPIVLIAVSAGLIFLPTVFELVGSAFFGDAAQPGMPLSNTLTY